MARRKKQNLMMFAGTFLLVLSVVIGGSKLWNSYRSTHYKVRAEIIYCYPNTRSVLAAKLDSEYSSLFTFSWPVDEKRADPALKQSGTLVELTGADGMLMSYPAIFDSVSAVKKTGQRDGLVEDYYFDLRQELQGKDAETVYDTVNALESLSDEEKEGLKYLLANYLKL